MKELLKVLVCEEAQADVELLISQLEQNSYDVDFSCVNTVKGLKDALSRTFWDIIISNNDIPGFDVLDALDAVREYGLDIPFVVVSGSLPEDAAIYMIKAGVKDYLMKDNLLKLGALVRRELEDVKRRRQLNAAIEQIKINEKKYRAIVDNSPLAIVIGKPDGSILEFNKAASDLFGYSSEEFRGLSRQEVMSVSDPELAKKLAERNHLKNASGVLTGIRKNGQKFYCETSSVMYKDVDGEDITCSMLSDISSRIEAELKLKNANAELKQLSIYLKNAREEERKYVAREIHDELGQLASVVKIELDWLLANTAELPEKHASRIQYALTAVTDMIDATRRICSSLRPHIIDQKGLTLSLRWQCQEFEKLNGIRCLFTEDFDDSGITIEIQTELYRICQEALTNVMRHAMATEVTVRVSKAAEDLELTITDNGKGFDTGNKTNHFGLIGLRERALSINGTVEIESTPGRGTTIKIIVSQINQSL